MLFKIVSALFLIYLSFLSHPHPPICALSISVPSLNYSFDKFRNASREVKEKTKEKARELYHKLSGTKRDNLRKFEEDASEIAIPSSETSTNNITEEEESKTFFQVPFTWIGNMFGKKKTGFPKTTTLNPQYILERKEYSTTIQPPPIPVEEKPITCLHHKNRSVDNQDDCTTASQLVSFRVSWYVILLVLSGVAVTAGAAALAFFVRKRKKTIPDFLKNFMPPQTKILPTRSAGARAPAPLPVCETARPVPRLPATPPPAPLRVNSLYQNETKSTTKPGHEYAVPTLRPSQHTAVWAPGRSDHVHVYEPPPSYPSFDSGDSEIDTSSFRNNDFQGGKK